MARVTKSTLEFPYSRTVGPIVGAFFSGLREHRLVGIRGADGKVFVPPLEYDPNTGDALSDLIDVGPAGTVESWTWVDAPTSKHPLQHPFAFALIKPDGADTAMVHAVDAGSADKMRTGMRVQPRWRAETHNRIDDLEAWEPEA
ncbi:MAG TPA: OB-fold domain-containing protein [Acidimicrobiia bacterium]|jgi:uncharacterized OB-fold protein|nr:OB-fold domain-containing protein [Acidimicrobiia bacterium]